MPTKSSLKHEHLSPSEMHTALGAMLLIMADLHGHNLALGGTLEWAINYINDHPPVPVATLEDVLAAPLPTTRSDVFEPSDTGRDPASRTRAGDITNKQRMDNLAIGNLAADTWVRKQQALEQNGNYQIEIQALRNDRERLYNTLRMLEIEIASDPGEIARREFYRTLINDTLERDAFPDAPLVDQPAPAVDQPGPPLSMDTLQMACILFRRAISEISPPFATWNIEQVLAAYNQMKAALQHEAEKYRKKSPDAE